MNDVIPASCMLCCRPLTEMEFTYYGFRCEACEREQAERVFAWRGGADEPKPTRH